MTNLSEVWGLQRGVGELSGSSGLVGDKEHWARVGGGKPASIDIWRGALLWSRH